MSSVISSPRVAVVLGLGAIIPAVAYGATKSLSAGVLAAVNVALIIAVLLVAFGPVRHPDEHLPA